MRFLALFLSLFMIVGCSSSQKAAGGSTVESSSTNANGTGKGALNEGEILERYQLSELNGASTLLKLVTDRASQKPKEGDVPAEPAVDCAITSEQATAWQRPLRALIDHQIEVAREGYTQDPIAYSRSAGFETCGAHCSCGVYYKVIQSVPAGGLKTPKEKTAHRRFQQRLEAKNTRISPEETLSCARKQNWFCSSDLRTYLEAHAN